MCVRIFIQAIKLHIVIFLFEHMQERRRREYADLWRARFQGHPPQTVPMPVWHLNDNPSARLCWNATTGALGSPRTCMGPQWIEPLQRPVLISERLECMGFSTDPSMKGAVFADAGMKDLNYTRLIGNVMHAFSASCMLCIMLACVQQEPSSSSSSCEPAGNSGRSLLLDAFNAARLGGA